MTAKKYPELTKSQALMKAWRYRDGFTHGLAGTKIHNSWRAMRFTIKGKKVGNEERWDDFNLFCKDMADSYIEESALCRKDKKKKFSLGNCFWGNKYGNNEHRISTLEYNGETKSLLEWCLEYNLNYSGVRQRFFNCKKKLPPKEILFGRMINKKRPLLSIQELNEKEIKTKAIKMISSNKCRDKKRGFVTEIYKPEIFIETILKKECIYCGSNKNVGADRINNHKGHTLSNIVPACYRCNVMRGDHFSMEQMKKIGVFLREKIDNDLMSFV